MVVVRSFILYSFLSILLIGCRASNTIVTDLSLPPSSVSPSESTSASVCPLTEPVWAKPSEDSAVLNSPEYGNYFVNEDRSMWVSAWWTEKKEYYLQVSEEGNKVGWFRPEGATLEITGRRIDGEAPPLKAYIPCCYPTRFQTSSLIFPTEGCWEVTGKAADRVLSFVVRVAP
jgi:hypothetical protein